MCRGGGWIHIQNPGVTPVLNILYRQCRILVWSCFKFFGNQCHHFYHRLQKVVFNTGMPNRWTICVPECPDYWEHWQMWDGSRVHTGKNWIPQVNDMNLWRWGEDGMGCRARRGVENVADEELGYEWGDAKWFKEKLPFDWHVRSWQTITQSTSERSASFCNQLGRS